VDGIEMAEAVALSVVGASLSANINDI
jgi:hypothetical protein